MKIDSKKSLFFIILIFMLAVSISSISAVDLDDSADELANYNDDDFIQTSNVDDLTIQSNDDVVLNEGNSDLLKDSSQVVDSMPQLDTGVVSGGVDYIAVNPDRAKSGSLTYDIPANLTEVRSAIVIVNVYSGSGSDAYGLYSNVTLNTNNGLEVLGYETLTFDKVLTNDPNVYYVNDHATKQYSDYQMVYDITSKVNGLHSGDSITIGVEDTAIDGKQFDGTIKLISLLFAYDDGDLDNYTYWLNAGQLWTQTTANFDFETRNYNGRYDNVSLRTIALSSSQAKTFKINDDDTIPDAVRDGTYYFKENTWNNVATYFNQGSNTNFFFESAGASYKTTVALLVATELDVKEDKIYVDYTNGLNTNDGMTSVTPVKTIDYALSLVGDNGIICVADGVNYLGDADVNGLVISKNVSIIGMGDNSVIDANNAGRIFSITGVTVNFSNLVFANANVAGASDKRGGAVWANNAVLNIDDCKFINNTAGKSSSYGGAINLKASTANIKASYFENNSAFYTGGAINAETSNILLNISDSVFTANAGLNSGWVSGGAICSYNTVIINRSVFYSNILADGKNGRSINQYDGSLTIANSILLDGANSVYVKNPSEATIENNWWGNNDLNKDSNPKDLGYTNDDVTSYLYLNITGADSVYVGDQITIGINLISNDGSEVSVLDVPMTISASEGTLDSTDLILKNGKASVKYTATTADSLSLTSDILGNVYTISLNSEEPPVLSEVYVDYVNGDNANSGIDWNNAVKTIEKGLERIDGEGTIYVAEGTTYLDGSTPASGISIDKDVTIIGENINAVITGENAKRIFDVQVGASLTIYNLTLTKGRGDYGGAIRIQDGGNTNPVVYGNLKMYNSVISDCYATTMGGGIGTNRGSISNIYNVTFIDNSGSNNAGGIAIQQTGTISNMSDCKFINNYAGSRGGAIYTGSNTAISLGENNYFEGNIASGNYGFGGAIHAGNGMTLGTGNVFINNKATRGGAISTANNKIITGSYCFFINNTCTDISEVLYGNNNNGVKYTLENCYWGTNNPDFANYLNRGTFTHNSYLVLTLSDDESVMTGQMKVITADLLKNQNGVLIDADSLPKNIPITFTATNGDLNTVSTTLQDGVASTVYTATLFGDGSVTANIYGATETLNFNVLAELGTVFVDYANGLDTNDGSEWDKAVKTIEHALTIVGDNKPVYVADGVNYLDNVDVNGLTISKNISVIGVGDNVVIDANNVGRIFNIDGLTVNFSNLVFANANVSGASDKRGGAIWANNAVLNIDNCKFVNNTAGNLTSSYGGAINLKGTTTTIKNSYFDSNSARSTGAAINVQNDNILLNISDSVFTNNALLQSGWSAGVAICSYNTVIIDRSVFYNNKLTDNTRNGRSINQYGTGSLTVTNSILLDGERSVYVATPSATVLENNWWGNTDINKDSNPKDLGYTNADVSSYLIMATSLDKEIVHLEESLTITVTLNQNQNGEELNNAIELPLILDVNLGTVSPNSTTLIAESQATYTPVAIGDEVLKINVLGVEAEYPFVVKDAIAKVTLDSVTTQWSSGIYPGVYNIFTIKITNNDERLIENLTIELYSNETDELLVSYTFDSIENGTYTVSLVDPTIRDITEQTVWPGAEKNKIEFTVDLKHDGEVIASNSYDKSLAYDGYLNKTYSYGGHDNIINRNYTINGDVIIATQDVGVYMDQFSRFRNETWNIATPEDAEIVKVLLYFNYNWDTSFFPNGWSLKFNDKDILSEYITHETDRGNLGGWGAYNYGLLVFDVTDYYKPNAENSFIINKTLNCALYPSTLYVLYNVTNSDSIKDVYFADICDVFYPLYNTVGYDDLTKFVVNFDNINTADLVNATWYVFSGSSSMYNNLSFNNLAIENPFVGSSANDCHAYEFDVTGVINQSNEAWFISGPTSSTTVAYEQVLVVTRTNDIKAPANIAADDLVMTYKNGTWAVTLTDSEGNAISNAVVKVSLNINGVDKVYDRVTDVNGVARLPINLIPGTYAVNATFEGDDQYESAFANATVTVNKAAPVLTAEDLTMSYKDGSGWSVSLTGIDGVAISGVGVKIGVAVGNGVVYTRTTDANGVASLPINLAPGTYAVNATFAGNNYYESAFVNATVTVEKAVATISAEDLTMNYKDGSKYNVAVVDGNGAALAGVVVKFTVGTSNYNIKTDANGVASLPINLNIGEYTVSATVNDAKYESATISNAVSVQNNIKISASDINMTYQDGTAYTVQLVNENGDPVALAGQIVKITVKGKTYDRKTDANGIATLPINLIAGEYVLTAEYNGITLTNNVTVNKA